MAMRDSVREDMEERKDMLILAQQKLDEIHRCNIGLCGGRPGSSSSRNRRKSAMSNHLLSSLLYVALMSYKIEDIKALLREEDTETFAEWEVLLNSLHSPEFHSKERAVQNKRVKTAYERKRQYKDVSTGLQEELTDTTNKLTELQRINNETNQHMSRAINVLQDERTSLASKIDKKQTEIDELKEELHDVKSWLEKVEADEKRKDEAIERLNQQLESKESVIKDLKSQTSLLQKEQSALNERVLDQGSTIKDLTSRLEQNESSFATYKSEKESLIDKLYQDLKETEARHTSAKAQLESSKTALDEARKDLESHKKSIESKVDTLTVESTSSFSDVKSLLSNVESTLSRTETLVKTANELQAESNNHTSAWIEKSQVFDKVAEGSDKLNTSIVKLSSQSDQIGSSFSGVQQDITAANQSLAKLERISDRIKDSLSEVKISLSASSTNDVIISRLENRSVHIEEVLASIQQGLSDAITVQNRSTIDSTSITDKTNASVSRLEAQIKQIQDALSTLQSCEEKSIASATKAFSKLECRTDQILTCVHELGSPQSDESTTQVLSRLESSTSEMSSALQCVKELLSAVIVDKQTPALVGNQSSHNEYKIETHSVAASSSATQEDISIDEPLHSTMAANNLVESCVSETVSAISPSKIEVAT